MNYEYCEMLTKDNQRKTFKMEPSEKKSEKQIQIHVFYDILKYLIKEICLRRSLYYMLLYINENKLSK